MQRAPIYVVMRYSNSFAEVKDTIKSHTEVIKEFGSVWMGKMGKTLGGKHIAAIEEQKKAGRSCYLYLVQRVDGVYEVYKGTIVEIKRGLPERSLVPKYYFARDLFKWISLWIKLSKIEKVHNSILDDLIVNSSGIPMSNTLTKSMAALFIVRNKKDN